MSFIALGMDTPTVEASILCHTMRKQGERDNARNNARCTQARKTTHGLDGQHEDLDRTLLNDRDKWRKYVHGCD